MLITGASSGVGEQTALRYAERGCRLVLAARGAAELEDVARRCREASAADVLTLPTDIGERDQVEELFDVALSRFGQLDIVVQNAAVAAFGRFVDVPAEVFDAVIRVNVLGAANVTRSALQHFNSRGHGQLVIVDSSLGQVAVPYLGVYVIGKFAVTALIRVLRQEYRQLPDVKIHGIYPGAVNTPIYARAANFFGQRAHVLPVNDAPAKVARRIVHATDSGRTAERQVGVFNYPMLIAYRTLPRVFDVLVGPLMKLGGFAREPLAVTTGNVFKKVGAVARGLNDGEENDTMHGITEQFVTALDELHRNRDAGPLVDLFANDATLSKVGVPQTKSGKDGARSFWEQYRDGFDSISADFRQVTTNDSTAFLEWTSQGTLSNGHEFRYDGVSVLEGSEDAIESFRTYYDTAAFLPK
ncbi:SDR family NAD(P)-dependent oxidoreductase [Mycobacterium sp. 1423905.2]|uniref:SDR family NAD(P)-dependent oxidoreductase n=1 Tax=Mycobacterium sp. 1423905.2 TaxID=1856859 RepID=UPI001560D27B|nr:SDR family NAD(P)-dependent oxidoreductase [Mycobacterium sp. 1423905.2]